MRYSPFSTATVQIRDSEYFAASPRPWSKTRSLAIGAFTTASLALSVTAFAQAGSNPHSLLVRYGDRGSADAIFYFDLGNGAGSVVDQLRRNPDEGRIARLKTNLFTEIGRSRDQAATVGEIFLGPLRGSDGQVRAALFVEASTGYTMYFDQLGKGGNLGRVTTMIKRGFESIASADRNFALLMRRNSSGRTDGAYLYHATTGKALHLGGLEELEIDPPVTPVADLPVLKGQVSAAPIVSREETIGYVVIDNADGALHFFDASGSLSRFSVRSPEIVLSKDLTAESMNPSTQRFVPVPLQNDEITTYAILIVDVGTGNLAIVDGLRNPKPQVRVLSQNLYGSISGGLRTDVWRHFAAADANGADGATRGAWVLDSLTGTLVYVDSPGNPANTRIRRVTLDR